MALAIALSLFKLHRFNRGLRSTLTRCRTS